MADCEYETNTISIKVIEGKINAESASLVSSVQYIPRIEQWAWYTVDLKFVHESMYECSLCNSDNAATCKIEFHFHITVFI